MYVDDPTLSQAKRKVLNALSDPRWDYRTVEGLSKETGVTPQEVEQILREFRNRIVHQAPFPDRFGRDLYTISNGRPDIRDLLARLRILLGKAY